jgi:ABC-2 type transport system permease protein
LCAITVCLVDGVLNTSSLAHTFNTSGALDGKTFDPVGAALDGLGFAVLAFGLLGVLTISSEYSTGRIRATLAAVPRRSTMYAAKLLVLAAVTLLVGEFLAFFAFFVGQTFLSRANLDVRIGDPHVLRAVSSAGLYLCVAALVGFGPGSLIRHTAGAAAATFGVPFLAYGLGRTLEAWSYVPSRLVLVNAAEVVGEVDAWAPHPRLPSLGLAYLDLILSPAILVALGAWRASRAA